MARCNVREQCGKIPHPIMLLFVVSAIFIITGLNRRGLSFLFAGSFAFLLAIAGWVWYKRNGNRFNIKFLDQLSGQHQQTEGYPDDDEVEMRYMDSSRSASAGANTHNVILMHNPATSEHMFGPPVVMVPPPYSSIGTDPGQAPPYSPNPQEMGSPASPPQSGSEAPSRTVADSPAVPTDSCVSPHLPGGEPPLAPPSYDSLFPQTLPSSTTENAPTAVINNEPIVPEQTDENVTEDSVADEASSSLLRETNSNIERCEASEPDSTHQVAT